MDENSIYSTKELENYVNLHYKKLRSIAEKDGIYVALNVNFGTKTFDGGDGTYCYADQKGYHYCNMERGKKYEEITQDIFEITYWIISFATSMMSYEYEVENRSLDQDSRRKAFAKQLELLEAVGEEYKQKREKELDEILIDAPYDDKK